MLSHRSRLRAGLNEHGIVDGRAASQRSVVAGARNTRFLRLVERPFPACCIDRPLPSEGWRSHVLVSGAPFHQWRDLNAKSKALAPPRSSRKPLKLVVVRIATNASASGQALSDSGKLVRLELLPDDAESFLEPGCDEIQKRAKLQRLLLVCGMYELHREWWRRPVR